MGPEAVRTKAPLDDVPSARLFAMQRAGREYREARRVLEKAGLNIVGEVLRGQGTFTELEHYPADDVFDAESGAQYYYHAHRGTDVEHGHFHTFVRTGRLEAFAHLHPARACAGQPAGAEAIAHLVAISMDAWGWPIGLFVTNRWVTDETWYSAKQVASLLPCFDVDHAWPSLPANRAIGALMRLFRPQILDLLVRRDEAIRRHEALHRGGDVLEDRALDLLAVVPIDVDAQIEAVDERLHARAAHGPRRMSMGTGRLPAGS